MKTGSAVTPNSAMKETTANRADEDNEEDETEGNLTRLVEKLE